MSKHSPGPAWVSAICSVVFDIDEGQKLEQCFPENALTEEEANDVAFHCFPVPAQEAASLWTVMLMPSCSSGRPFVHIHSNACQRGVTSTTAFASSLCCRMRVMS